MTSMACYPDDDGSQGRGGDRAGARDRAGGVTGSGGAQGEVPFGLPVLAEVPELAGLLADLRAIDRLVARVLDVLLVLEDTSLAETATGLPVERWMATVGLRTRADRRMLQTAATACRRLPGVHDAFGRGQLSWAQLRVIALKLQRLPTHHDAAIDTELTTALDTAGDVADPDSLAHIVAQVLAAYEPAAGDPRERDGAPEHDVLAMQPRLDGSGGLLFGDFGPAGFAAIDNRLTTGPPPHPCRDGLGHDPDPHPAAATARQLARRRADRLVELCTHQPDRPHAPGRPVPASYVVRVEVATLLRLGADQAATLLTHLTDGAMWLDAATARTLADTHGARLRTVLLDQGRVVGVGRATSRPPGWLTEATLALHDTCTAPGCRVAARVCDTDHARPYSRGGPTDIDNLAPLCATDNHTKEPHGWTCTQHPDGRRTWHHPRTGITTTTLPATWRPPDASRGEGSPVGRNGDDAPADDNGDHGDGATDAGRAPP
jgi:hypothetical protein